MTIKLAFDFCDFDLPFDDELRRRSGKALTERTTAFSMITIDADFEREILQYPHKLDLHFQEMVDYIKKAGEMREAFDTHAIQRRTAQIFYSDDDERDDLGFRLLYFFETAEDASAGRFLP
ncbi:hypothetical protein [Sphingobium indicum]|nr:hypothetical protein [Sphingobium indicum]